MSLNGDILSGEEDARSEDKEESSEEDAIDATQPNYHATIFNILDHDLKELTGTCYVYILR